ncbi:MAG: OB-fold domain-containing protein [Acidobacteriota bacterium]|nr:OB-fold domain-containing protein [Acidobacteriota bacterium]
MSDVRQGVWPSPIDDPYANEVTQPFWDAAADGRLLGYRCDGCGTFISPPPPRCFQCQGTAFTWVDLPGGGTIYSFTVVRHPLAPYLQAAVPYVSAVVELDGTQGAGARLLVNVIDCDPDGVQIGDRVEVTFEKVSETLTVPRFRPRLG